MGLRRLCSAGRSNGHGFCSIVERGKRASPTSPYQMEHEPHFCSQPRFSVGTSALGRDTDRLDVVRSLGSSATCDLVDCAAHAFIDVHKQGASLLAGIPDARESVKLRREFAHAA